MDEPIPKLNSMEKAVLDIIRYHGTNTQGPLFKMYQQAQTICQLFYELDKGTQLLKDFQRVKVVPR